MEKCGCTPDELLARLDASPNGGRYALTELMAYFHLVAEETPKPGQ